MEVNDWSAAQGAGVRAHRFLGRGVLCRRCCRRRTGVSHDSFGVKLRTSQTRGIHVRKASKQNTAKKRKSPLNWDPVWRAVEAPAPPQGGHGAASALALRCCPVPFLRAPSGQLAPILPPSSLNSSYGER